MAPAVYLTDPRQTLSSFPVAVSVSEEEGMELSLVLPSDE